MKPGATNTLCGQLVEPGLLRLLSQTGRVELGHLDWKLALEALGLTMSLREGARDRIVNGGIHRVQLNHQVLEGKITSPELGFPTKSELKQYRSDQESLANYTGDKADATKLVARVTQEIKDLLGCKDTLQPMASAIHYQWRKDNGKQGQDKHSDVNPALQESKKQDDLLAVGVFLTLGPCLATEVLTGETDLCVKHRTSEGFKCKLGTLYCVDLTAPHGSPEPEGDRLVWFFGFSRSCLERPLAFNPPIEITELTCPKCKADRLAVRPLSEEVEDRFRTLGKDYAFKVHCVTTWKTKRDNNLRSATAREWNRFKLNGEWLHKLEAVFSLQITSVSFLHHRAGTASELHIDSASVCKVQGAIIAIASLSVEKGQNHTYQLTIQEETEESTYEVPFNHVYTFEGARRWAYHSFKTTHDKYTWRFEGNDMTKSRL